MVAFLFTMINAAIAGNTIVENTGREPARARKRGEGED
jgi:hypothetical protein